MAEVVAGLWAAEEVVSTGVQAGAAGYAIAKPTMPLKATFSQLASTMDDKSSSSLIRSHHTVTIVNKKAYIFGGWTSHEKLASNDIHSIALPVKGAPAPEYQVLPAIATGESKPVPTPRTNHAACALGTRIAIYGGCDEVGKPVDEGSHIWLYDTEKSSWDILESSSHPERVPPPRSNGKLFSHDGNLILYGGLDYYSGSPLTDVWRFDCFANVWNQFPHAPVATKSAALSGDTLYLITASGSLSNDIHSLKVRVSAEPPTWETISFPINPLTPGPKSRENGGLVPVTTGYGRNYLLYFFGEQRNMASHGGFLQWSDLWTFQLPSSDLEPHASTNVTEAIKPAKIKDQIRSQLGADTGRSTWAEVEVQAPGDRQAQGKAHPGPRSSFGYDVTADKTKVVVWGGIDAKGEPQGDGWVIELT